MKNIFIPILSFFLFVNIQASEPIVSKRCVYDLDWAIDYLNLSEYPSSFKVPVDDSNRLVPPIVERGSPKTGHRVRVYLDEYPKAPYSIFLPYNFTDMDKWSVIFEVPGTPCLPDTNFLGYGITRGLDYIWVSVPFVDKERKILRGNWGKNPSTTVNYWLAVLDDLNKKFHIDNDKIVIAGFSLGAAAVSSFGNWNDLISSKWAAYFSNSHFDGCCQTCPGDPNERIKRINGKKVLIAVGENDRGKKCSWGAYTKLKNMEFPVTYIEIPNLNHFSNWVLEESESAEEARLWLKNLFTEA